MTVQQLVKTFPVVEVFGPVVQGEGPVAGQVTHFVRLGLCDYRCVWCDSMFAVLPVEVKKNATQLSVAGMMGRLSDLEHGAPWVTLSGGNPAIHDLEELVDEIHEAGMQVAVETQGSRWKPWLSAVDMLVVSPKPPSSEMVNEVNRRVTDVFMHQAERSVSYEHRAIKIVVFDDRDLVWADAFMVEYPWAKLYLSVGTDVPEPGETLAETRRKVCDRYQWLSDRVPYLASEVTIMPQLHVLAYGHARGV